MDTTAHERRARLNDGVDSMALEGGVDARAKELALPCLEKVTFAAEFVR